MDKHILGYNVVFFFKTEVRGMKNRSGGVSV